LAFKQKNVLHILSSLNVGGAERFVIDLAIEQRHSLALNSAILSFGDKKDALVEECINNGIRVYFIEGSKLNKILAFRKIMKEFDVVHFHSPFTLLFACYDFILSYKKRIIYTRHGAEPFKQSKWRLMHKFAKYIVNDITFVSDEGKAVFGEVHGWEHKSKSVIDNGVLLPDTKAQQLTEAESTKIRLGSVARMVPLKNQICLLRALSIMPKEISNKFELHFFGDGPCEDLLRSETKKLNLDGNVTFHGMLINRDEIYKQMNVMVVTSEMEGLSIAILEAMARKIPVLATNVGGNPKLVQNNVTGQLFEYDCHEMLSKQLIDIANSPNIICNWGEQAYTMVKNNYSLGSVAQKYMKLYLSQ
jgi:glycosyltransferase involved in cell wall biosynthesis